MKLCFKSSRIANRGAFDFDKEHLDDALVFFELIKISNDECHVFNDNSVEVWIEDENGDVVTDLNDEPMADTNPLAWW